MNRVTIEIRKIDGGWLLSVGGCEMNVAVPQERYFETLPKVLEYLKVNEHVFK